MDEFFERSSILCLVRSPSAKSLEVKTWPVSGVIYLEATVNEIRRKQVNIQAITNYST